MESSNRILKKNYRLISSHKNSVILIRYDTVVIKVVALHSRTEASCMRSASKNANGMNGAHS